MQVVNQISAGEFKAKCLQLMDEVKHQQHSIVITKRGIPVARLVPFEEQKRNLFGCLKGSVTIHDDIVAPIDVQWSAQKDED